MVYSLTGKSQATNNLMKNIFALLSKIFKAPVKQAPAPVEPVEEFIAPEASAPPVEEEKPKKRKVVKKKDK